MTNQWMKMISGLQKSFLHKNQKLLKIQQLFFFLFRIEFFKTNLTAVHESNQLTYFYDLFDNLEFFKLCSIQRFFTLEKRQ